MKSFLGSRSTQFLIAIALLSTASVWAQSNGAAAQAAVNKIQASEQTATDLKGAIPASPISTGDLLDISLFGTQDFHQEARVSNTGDISLPLIGSSHVSGLTPEGAATDIRNKLIDGNFYKNPQVTVLVKDYATSGIYVLGEVQKPGFYPIVKANTLLQAIALAGGTTPKASRLTTISNPNRDPKELSVRMSNDGKGDGKDQTMMAGDTVTVLKAGIVYVVGEVHLPTGIVMDNENLTVLQAIALAQGTNPNAALDKAQLIRRTADGPQQQALPLKKMLEAKAPDVKVMADDIIFVPKSGFSAFSKRGAEAILQAATGVAMYARY